MPIHLLPVIGDPRRHAAQQMRCQMLYPHPGQDQEAGTLLRSERGFDRLQTQAMGIASLLEEKAAIPLVAAQLALLQEIQTDAFWEGIDVVQLENVRRKLRSLVKLIEKSNRKIVYTTFDDELAEEMMI